jgi:four helix bundle protein
MAKSFKELRIWQKGYELLIAVYKITRTYPSEELFGLSRDTRRSANSAIANIAESHGRYFFKDKIRVLYIVRGELDETRSHLLVAVGLNYITEEQFKYFDNEYEGLIIGVNDYINSLRLQEKESRDNKNGNQV